MRELNLDHLPIRLVSDSKLQSHKFDYQKRLSQGWQIPWLNNHKEWKKLQVSKGIYKWDDTRRNKQSKQTRTYNSTLTPEEKSKKYSRKWIYITPAGSMNRGEVLTHFNLTLDELDYRIRSPKFLDWYRIPKV